MVSVYIDGQENNCTLVCSIETLVQNLCMVNLHLGALIVNKVAGIKRGLSWFKSDIQCK